MRRDVAIEDAAASYFESESERAAHLEQVTETERAMARDIQTLVDLKESRSRIATMLDVDTREVGRLLRLLDTGASGDTSETGAVSDTGDAESPSSPERDGAPTGVGSDAGAH